MDKIKRAKEEILEGMVLIPKHNHRDPAMSKNCDSCQARYHLAEAYKKLPSEQVIKEFMIRYGIK